MKVIPHSCFLFRNLDRLKPGGDVRPGDADHIHLSDEVQLVPDGYSGYSSHRISGDIIDT